MLLWICDLVTSGVVSAACLVAGRPQLPPDTLNLFMTSRECGGSISPNSLERFQLAHRQIPWLIEMVIGFLFFFQLKVARNPRRVVQTELVVAEAETLMLLRHALAVTLFLILFFWLIFFSLFGSVPVCSPQQQRVADQHRSDHLLILSQR